MLQGLDFGFFQAQPIKGMAYAEAQEVSFLSSLVHTRPSGQATTKNMWPAPLPPRTKTTV
jgi:hypothetical protein